MNALTLTPPRTKSTVLMDRFTGGILVELVYSPPSPVLDIRVTVAGDVESAPVPLGRELDAFEHPYMYLPR